MVTTRPPKTIVKPTALGPVANTDTKLLIYGLFQRGRVLAQDGVRIAPDAREINLDIVRAFRCGSKRKAEAAVDRPALLVALAAPFETSNARGRFPHSAHGRRRRFTAAITTPPPGGSTIPTRRP